MSDNVNELEKFVTLIDTHSGDYEIHYVNTDTGIYTDDENGKVRPLTLQEKSGVI